MTKPEVKKAKGYRNPNIDRKATAPHMLIWISSIRVSFVICHSDFNKDYCLQCIRELSALGSAAFRPLQRPLFPGTRASEQPHKFA